MVTFIPVLAAAVALALPPKRHKHRRGMSSARLTSLALRRELLHDFLVETNTETPGFVDRRIVRPILGVEVGPTSVTSDFLGATIVRARVTNTTRRSIDVLVSASVHDVRGVASQASAWVERLAPGGSSAVELLCPVPLQAESVDWTAIAL